MALTAPASAAEFTNKDFLTWEKRDRDRWLGGAVLMAAQMAHLHDADIGDCILRWYFQETTLAQRQILDRLSRNPDLSPTTVLIGLMRGECGVQLILQ